MFIPDEFVFNSVSKMWQIISFHMDVEPPGRMRLKFLCLVVLLRDMWVRLIFMMAFYNRASCLHFTYAFSAKATVSNHCCFLIVDFSLSSG